MIASDFSPEVVFSQRFLNARMKGSLASQNSVNLRKPAVNSANLPRRPDSTRNELAFESGQGQQVAG